MLQAGAFAGGKQVGKWKWHHPNGKLAAEGAYEDGRKIGEWKTYDASGKQLKSQVHRS